MPSPCLVQALGVISIVVAMVVLIVGQKRLDSFIGWRLKRPPAVLPVQRRSPTLLASCWFTPALECSRTGVRAMSSRTAISRWIIPVLVLPGTLVVLIPWLIPQVMRGTRFAATPVGPNLLLFWLAMLFGILAAALSIWSISSFFRIGDRTAAPWDPPQRLTHIWHPFGHRSTAVLRCWRITVPFVPS